MKSQQSKATNLLEDFFYGERTLLSFNKDTNTISFSFGTFADFEHLKLVFPTLEVKALSPLLARDYLNKIADRVDNQLLYKLFCDSQKVFRS